MVGEIYILNKNTSKIVKIIDYEELIYNDKLKKKLKDNYLNKDYLEMVCGCNKNIRLGIDSLGRIYHKKKDDLLKHNKFCMRNPDYNKYNSLMGWKENDNYILVNFKDKNNNNNSLDLKRFLELLNLYSWNSYLYKYSSLPNNKFDFLNRIFGLSNKIKISNLNNATLNSIFFNIKDYKNIKKDEIKFTYMYLKSFDINIKENIVTITGEYSENKIFSFVVDRYIFTQRYMSIKEAKIKNHLVFGAFIKKCNNKFKIIDFEFIRVNTLGLHCNTAYESKLFNMFCNNKIAFIKPYKPIPIYNGDVPTAILLSNNSKNIYVEIFDSNSSESLKYRETKIEYTNKFLKNTHRLIRWDVYNNRNLPSLSYIKKIIK